MSHDAYVRRPNGTSGTEYDAMWIQQGGVRATDPTIGIGDAQIRFARSDPSRHHDLSHFQNERDRIV